ncbi:MAG TPA: Hsp70 family protein [Anaeromyxobacter sp.]|nr:Hsp70 family protein [Anaeromyxobacter sp.]
MSAPRYLVGIDLGTVNTALASVDLERSGDLAEIVEPWPVPQLVGRGQVAPRRLLPSALYLAGPELPGPMRHLPWAKPGEDGTEVVGELARIEGAGVPGRLVVSAKSWLANPRADRRASILPWGAPEEVPRVSPVAASARYLEHLRQAWDAAHPGAELRAQEIVLAVPASFDEVARELTLEAAAAAGLPQVSLLEEPAAAFHDWASRHRADLSLALGGSAEQAGGATLLVVDVGGGTTDLTLLRAEVRDGRPTFTRLAVGDHLLLGGDNMDLSLARLAEAQLPEKLDPARFAALVLSCRTAKEQLLADEAPEEVRVAVVGRGSRLLSGAATVALSREEVRGHILEGFFPEVAPGDRPRRTARTAGLAELGLPYEPDPAITRHLAAFLSAHAGEARGPGGLVRPDALLLNGGVFAARRLRDRLAVVVGRLFPGAPPLRVLASPALDLSVARGAALSGLARRGLGLRIGGGSARAFYVGIATAAGERALCVVPRHLEEGSRVAVPRPFRLSLGRPVRFPLFASVRPRLEQPGDLVEVGGDLDSLSPLEAVLGENAGRAGTTEIPVRLEAVLTEIGTLELWCVAVDRQARWKLEFGLRAAAAPKGPERPAAVFAAPRRLAEAVALVEQFYGRRAAVERKEVKGLFRTLEKVLGPRQEWPTPVVRELWAALHSGAGRRRRSPDHERVWLQLTGFALRPGFGAPLDSWRAAETFALYGEGLQYQADSHAWQAWWVLWRRIAGGLGEAAQTRILEAILPFVPPRDPRRPPPRVVGVKPEALDELLRLSGSLERIPATRKISLGEKLLLHLSPDAPGPPALWALGRVGARVPFAGSVHQVVPATVAADWTRRLIASGAPLSALAFPLGQLARRSGDRERDLPEDLRREVAEVLVRAGSPPEALRALEEVAPPSEEEETRIFGEGLPPGLRLETADVQQAPPSPPGP